MTKAKKTKEKNLAKKLTPQQFIQEFVKKQNELLIATAQCLENGEIEIVGVEYADDVIDTIVENWCEFIEPDIPLHLQMTAAVFLWALLDQMETDDGADSDENQPGRYAANDTTHPGFTVAVEILKTVRSIWGKESNNG